MNRPLRMMNLSVFRKIIDELAGFDFPDRGKVVLAGFGEPTLHPQFIEAVEYAGLRNLPLRIYTNGTRLDPRIRQALLHPGVKSLKVSINGHGADMFAQLTGNKTSWDHYVSQVSELLRDRLLRNSGPEITLQLLYSAMLPDHVKQWGMCLLDTPEMALQAVNFWQVLVLKIAKELDIPVMMESIQENEFILRHPLRPFDKPFNRLRILLRTMLCSGQDS